jgi:hypothetical protein
VLRFIFDEESPHSQPFMDGGSPYETAEISPLGRRTAMTG